MDKSNLFDQKIRDAINKYEVPFDDSAWKNIESKINVQPKGKVINWKTWIISTAAAAVLVVGYFMISPSTEKAIDHAENKKSEVVKPIDNKIENENDNSSLDEVKEESSINNEDIINEGENKAPEALPLIEDEKVLTENLDSNEEGNLIVDVTTEKEEDKKVEIANEAEELSLSVHINKEVLCENERISIAISQCNIPVELNWDFGDGQTAEGSTVSHVYNDAGEYQIIMTARSVLNDELVNTENYTIRVHPRPTAEFEIDKGDNMATYPEVTFSSLSEQVSSIEWKFADENVQASTIVEKLYRNKGSYSIGLIVKNQFQCSDTLYQSLVIENNFNLLAPNAFSPNGDGINDTFMPQALPYLNQGFTLQVFEPKTGQLIFESNDFTIPWNGNMMNNGIKMADGAYAWSVKTEDGSVYKGTILITTK